MAKLYLGAQEICPIVYDKETVPSVGIYRSLNNGKMELPMSPTAKTISLPSSVTNLGYRALYYGFYQSTGVTGVDLSGITTVSGERALYYAFYGCTKLTTLDFSALTTVSSYYAFYYAFYGCSSLTSIDFSNLTTISGSSAFYYAFYSCTSITSVTFTRLSSLTGSSALQGAFRNCSSLTTLSFPALTANSFGSSTNQFNNMLQGCSGVTVHFPAAVKTTIQNWSSVTGGFGGTNTTVLYDL